MALSADSKLIEFIGPSHAATQFPKQFFSKDLSDNIFNLMTEKVNTCEDFDLDIKPVKSNKSSSVILLHLNIRSLNKNFYLLNEFLVSLKFNVSIPNYNFYHVNSSSAAGGVAVYVSNKLEVKSYSTQFDLPNSESLWLEISEPKSNNVFITGVVFRHPDHVSINNFLENFSRSLEHLSAEKKVYYTF